MFAQSFHLVAHVSGSWVPRPYADSGSCSGLKNNSNTAPTYFQQEILYTTSTECSMEL